MVDSDDGSEDQQRARELTPRERQVLVSLSEGLIYRDIAKQMGVSINTVRTHVRGIYRKLSVSSKVAAYIKAQQLGLIESPRSRTDRQEQDES